MLHRSVRAAPILSLFLLSCVGPVAPDHELCRDVIARLCAQPTCVTAQSRLNLPAENCVAQLEMRTGCNSTEFVFTSPTREEVLTCRLPLVRDGAQRSAHPACDYVDETLRICPRLVVFLGGTP